MNTKRSGWRVGWTLFGLVVLLTSAADAVTIPVRVTIQNLAPVNGTFLTPLWVGFHDGTFDLYDQGVSAALFPGLESLAEDGDTAPLSNRFTLENKGQAQGTIFGPVIPPIAPGQTASMIFSLDGSLANGRYFSYATMIIPSNDAFIANGNPLAFPVFDAGGNFLGADFTVLGSQVLDAGTEVNDEIPMNTAFFGQMNPNTGVDENGVVQVHPGFKPPGSGGILDAAMFANANFKATGYQVARITVQVVPEPSTLVLLSIGLMGMGVVWLRRRRPGNLD
jgi:hypothetical protein